MPRATIIGSGPNGLAAAVALARAGYNVRVLEAAAQPGGGVRTTASTLPGFAHDIGSAVHPGYASSFFTAFGLRDRVEWIMPEAAYAHPLDGGRAAIAWRDLDRTAESLGEDRRVWGRLFAPLVADMGGVQDLTGNHLVRMPRHPRTAARFGLRALAQAGPWASRAFRGEAAAALFAGVVAHANTVLPSLTSAAAGLLLATQAHATGWPYPRGGAIAITDALLADLHQHGGTVETSTHVTDLSALDWGDPARGDLLLLDTSPRLLLTLDGVPAGYARAVRNYRYGPAAAKVDFALDGPVPWKHPDLALAPTIHLGGTREEIWASERAVARGQVSANPYVLAVQPSVLDPTRAPRGKATIWAYLHVPSNAAFDPTEAITAQVERFAPGFRDRILDTHTVRASERAAINPAAIGGDISGGAFTLRQTVRRPAFSATPWRTPIRGVYLASASTPPGPGVNGMAGWHAARTALADAGTPVSLDDLF